MITTIEEFEKFWSAYGPVTAMQRHQWLIALNTLLAQIQSSLNRSGTAESMDYIEMRSSYFQYWKQLGIILGAAIDAEALAQWSSPKYDLVTYIIRHGTSLDQVKIMILAQIRWWLDTVQNMIVSASSSYHPGQGAGQVLDSQSVESGTIGASGSGMITTMADLKYILDNFALYADQKDAWLQQLSVLVGDLRRIMTDPALPTYSWDDSMREAWIRYFQSLGSILGLSLDPVALAQQATQPSGVADIDQMVNNGMTWEDAQEAILSPVYIWAAHVDRQPVHDLSSGDEWAYQGQEIDSPHAYEGSWWRPYWDPDTALHSEQWWRVQQNYDNPAQTHSDRWAGISLIDGPAPTSIIPPVPPPPPVIHRPQGSSTPARSYSGEDDGVAIGLGLGTIIIGALITGLISILLIRKGTRHG